MPKPSPKYAAKVRLAGGFWNWNCKKTNFKIDEQTKEVVSAEPDRRKARKRPGSLAPSAAVVTDNEYEGEYEDEEGYDEGEEEEECEEYDYDYDYDYDEEEEEEECEEYDYDYDYDYDEEEDE